MDPLSLVRQATTLNQPVSYSDRHYVFTHTRTRSEGASERVSERVERLPEDTQTAFRRTHKGGG
jgi:hypothetical protein